MFFGASEAQIIIYMVLYRTDMNVTTWSLDQFFVLNLILNSARAEGWRAASDFAAIVRLYSFDVFWS